MQCLVTDVFMLAMKCADGELCNADYRRSLISHLIALLWYILCSNNSHAPVTAFYQILSELGNIANKGARTASKLLRQEGDRAWSEKGDPEQNSALSRTHR